MQKATEKQSRALHSDLRAIMLLLKAWLCSLTDTSQGTGEEHFAAQETPCRPGSLPHLLAIRSMDTSVQVYNQPCWGLPYNAPVSSGDQRQIVPMRASHVFCTLRRQYAMHTALQLHTLTPTPLALGCTFCCPCQAHTSV